jgi:FG-GAP-like repeat/FG-GAP repeat
LIRFTSRPRTGIRRALVAATLLWATSSPAYDWLQFDGDSTHSGSNTVERSLNEGNVGSLTRKYSVTLPAASDGTLVGIRGVALTSGIADVLFTTSTQGDIIAIDAGSGAVLWSKPHGPGTCKINNTGGPCYTTSTPAIDPNGIYVYSYGLDGFVHKHRITDGVETTTGGWPELAALKPFDEKGSSALALATVGSHVYLYVVHGGYPGDNGDYQGHLTTIDLSTGTQTVFNATCSDVHAHLGPKPVNPSPPPPLPYCTLPRNAIWSRPGVIYDESLGRLFVSTGNGTYTGNTDGLNWSESILAINPDGTSSAQGPNDAYTPQNFQSLDSGDADIGSTTIAVIPPLPGASVAHLGVQGGKDGKLRLVNLANLASLAGSPAPGHLGGEVGSIINIPQGGGLFSQPAVWRNPADDSVWVFVANGSGLSGLRMQVGVGGNPSLSMQWSIPQGGTSPLVAGNVLYYAASGALRAVSPTSGTILWSSPGGDVGSVHWQSPLVLNGVVYFTDGNRQLVAYAPAQATAGRGFDVDADRKSDIGWTTASGGTSLWKMNGLTATNAATIFNDPDWSISAYADFNGDSRSDLVWQNSTSGATAIWLMNGLSAMGSKVIWPDASWVPTQFGDFDGDGNTDIVWRNATSGATAIWLMQGLGTHGAAAVLSDPQWRVLFVADFDGDGRDDLLWYDATTGQTAIWLMDGLKARAGEIIFAGPWTVTATGDFNGDGKADLVWRNVDTGATAIWLMNGTHSIAASVIYSDPNWAVTQVADFNDDGRDDLLWRNASSGQAAVWLMRSTSSVASAYLVAGADWTPVQVGDTNGDGKADILWRNTQSGATSLWLMNGTGALDSRVLNPDSSLVLLLPVH